MPTDPTPVELIQSMYAAFGRGDVNFITSRVTPDCHWVAPGDEIPSGGQYHGPAGVAEFFSRLAESEDFLRFEPREFFTSGNAVVALGFEECRSRKTGQTASTTWAMHFRVVDGRVSYFEVFYDTAAYLRAHGMAPMVAQAGR